MTPTVFAIGACALYLFIAFVAGLGLAFEGAVNSDSYPRRRDRVVLRLLTTVYLVAILAAFAAGLGYTIVVGPIGGGR